MTEGFRPPTPGDLAARRPAPEEPAEVAPAGGGTGISPGGSGDGQGTPYGEEVEALQDGTGDERVDAAVRRLEAVDDLPVGEHVAQYDAVHRTLQDALAQIDEG